MRVAVHGAGYVGLVCAVCLADAGHDVVCCDTDRARVATLAHGRAPIFEPGLEPLLAANLAAQRLRFGSDAEAAARHGDVVFIAVGTPTAADGQADVAHVTAAARVIADHVRPGAVVVVKSTVPVGTTARLGLELASRVRDRGAAARCSVVSNPEFLREGSAVDDFRFPDRVVIGCDHADHRAAAALATLRALYAPFIVRDEQWIEMDTRSAELTKYAANAMLALRISFVNELARLAESLDADIEHVRRGVGSDPRIGAACLHAGCGWGGSCLPKDTRALAGIARDAGVPMPLLDAARAVNGEQRTLPARWVIERFGSDLGGRCIALWGLAFKPGTDDLREAPSRTLIDVLLAHGARVNVYDPVAMPNARAQWPPHGRLHYAASAMHALDGASALLLVTEWPQFRDPDFAAMRARLRDAVLYDGRNLYDPRRVRGFGFEYRGIGRGMPADAPPRAAAPASSATAQRLLGATARAAPSRA